MTVFAALEALDLSAGATEKDIRAAYRKLALVWHPDRFPPDSEVLKLAIAKMKQINHAFETLEAANFQTTTPAGGTNRGASQRDSGGQANDSGSKASDSEDRGVHDGKREIPPHAPSKAGSEDLTARASLATAKLALILGFLVFLGILSARVQFEFKSNSIGMELIELPVGKFLMGEGGGAVNVTLTKPFSLGKTEVTQGQWKSVMGSEPWKGQSEVKADKDCPATHVSWADAVAFCEKLTVIERKAGKLKANEEYRLPTEAEWEYACRAVTKTAFSFGDDLKQLDQYGWFDGNAKNVGRGFAHKVGLLKPNPAGLFDMHGNVSEWCSDWYGGKLSGGINPVGPEWDVNRVLRGGSWWSYPGFCRSAIRDYDVPSSRNGLLGFRVARSQSAQ